MYFPLEVTEKAITLRQQTNKPTVSGKEYRPFIPK